MHTHKYIYTCLPMFVWSTSKSLHRSHVFHYQMGWPS